MATQPRDLLDPSALTAINDLAVSEIAAYQEKPRCMEISVLVVEDNEFQKLAIQELLKGANAANDGVVNFKVTVVDTARQALSFLRSSNASPKVNLLLLDIFFGEGEVSGQELLPELRRCVGQDTAIVMLSAHQETSLVQDCLKQGADAYLSKPIRAEEVRHLWQYCIKRRHRAEDPRVPVQSKSGESRIDNRPKESSQPVSSCSTCDPGPRAPGACKLNAGLRPGSVSSPQNTPRSANSLTPRSRMNAIGIPAPSTHITGPAGTPGGYASHASNVHSRCRRPGNATGTLRPMGFQPPDANRYADGEQGTPCRQQ